MKIQLIEGEFNANEALDLITQMINVKIKYHENKIHDSNVEEDVKARESKIKRLQNELFELRNQFSIEGKKLSINTTINII